MKLRPFQDRVLIRPVLPEAKTSGGIIIPETAQEEPMEGEVLAVGPGARDAFRERRHLGGEPRREHQDIHASSTRMS